MTVEQFCSIATSAGMRADDVAEGLLRPAFWTDALPLPRIAPFLIETGRYATEAEVLALPLPQAVQEARAAWVDYLKEAYEDFAYASQRLEPAFEAGGYPGPGRGPAISLERALAAGGVTGFQAAMAMPLRGLLVFLNLQAINAAHAS